MSHRRRGADFSYLLQSFCDASDCGTDVAHRAASPERQDTKSEKDWVSDKMPGKKLEDEGNSETCSYKSTILAGQAAEVESHGSTENSYRTANSGSETERPIANVSSEACRSEIPSFMNKAINLQFSPEPDLDLSESVEEPESSDSSNGKPEASETFRDSRDTNYNIKSDGEIATSNPFQVPRSRVKTPKYGSRDGKGRKETDSVDIFKRLTQEFVSSPREFTERLVTIIESESGYVNDDNSGVNLSRMTQEFQKMCKYIQDESMPEHMNSTLGITRQHDENKASFIRIPDIILESPMEATSSYVETPRTLDDGNKAARKIYRKTPLNLFKKNIRENEADSPGSPNSTRHFVFLEKYLNEEHPTSPRTGNGKPIVRDRSDEISERMMEKMRIVQRSEQQLASLDETDNNQAFETFDSHPARDTRERNLRVDEHDTSVDDRAIDANELSNSLKLELEKQRERCFETARQMQKIEEDAMSCSEDYTKVLERYGIDPENECRKTINSLLNYQICRSQIQNVKRNEVSSIDSGIDTRSISRTLQASTKKSSNESALRGVAKKPAKTTSTKLPRTTGTPSSRLNTPRSLSNCGTKNGLRQNSFQSSVITRRKSPGNLCPTAKLGSPRSRVEKFFPQPAEMKTPRGVVERLEIPSEQSTPVSSNNAQASLKYRRGISGETKSPYSRCQLTASPSPTVTPSKNRTKSPTSTKLVKSPKNRFFVTPGKTVPIRESRRRSKLFFPTMNDDLPLEGPERIVKSPHAPGIYRRGMSTVVSPLSMYIRGTDTNLIQNIQPRTNQMLLTPTKGNVAEKLKFQLAAKSSTPRCSPCRTPLTREKDSEFHPDDNDENEREVEFALPKVNYERPGRVHTIDQSPKNVGGARIRGLLQPLENRVVVRHEGRIFGNCDENDSPASESRDFSIHVCKSAKKTNYLNGRK